MAYKVTTDTIAFREGLKGDGPEIAGAEFTIRRYLSKSDMDDYRTAGARMLDIVQRNATDEMKAVIVEVEDILMRALRAIHGVELEDSTPADPKQWRTLEEPLINQILQAIRDRNFEKAADGAGTDAPKGESSPNA